LARSLRSMPPARFNSATGNVLNCDCGSRKTGELSMKGLREKDGLQFVAHAPSPFILRGRLLMKISIALLPLAAAAGLAVPSPSFAQEPVQLIASSFRVASLDLPSAPDDLKSRTSAAAATASVSAGTHPLAAQSWHTGMDRWLTVNDMTYSMRYRAVTDINGAHEFNQGQERSILDGRFKFDEQGRYALAFHASSGKYFNWAYADFMGGGNKQAFALSQASATAAEKIKFGRAETVDNANFVASQSSGGWSFYVRELYADLEPVKGIEFQGGGLDINRGAASEITTYDNDGYITGERLLIKRPKQLFLDEISVTYAYLGDVFKPNMFARLDTFKHSDYHQFLLRKHVGKRVDASFDYTWQNAANMLHEDALVNVKESKVFDSVRVEYYQRLNGIYYPNVPHITTFFRKGGNGYAFTVDKKVKRLAMEGGFDSYDLQSGALTQVGVLGVMGMALNGDQYGQGKRYFARPVIQLTPYLSAQAYFTRLYGTQSDPTQVIWNKQAVNAGLVFDIRKALFRRDAGM
jgi:hypothetical protein